MEVKSVCKCRKFNEMEGKFRKKQYKKEDRQEARITTLLNSKNSLLMQHERNFFITLSNHMLPPTQED